MKFLIPCTFVLLAICLGCNQTITTLVSAPQATEAAFCTKSCVTDNTCTGSTVTVNGAAYYERRALTAGSGLGGRDTTGSGPSGNFPIRGAELQVLKNGNLFHCSSTSSTGTYTFVLPDDSATYTIKINSRAYSADNKASVLNSPTSKSYYSTTTTVVATGPGPLTANVPNAPYNGTLTGGAFNILDKIYEANVFLKTQTVSASTPFTVQHKVSAYWSKGINPNTYLGGDSSQGLSFYAVGTDELYILGGIDGDTNNEDTDHFDDSIIVHEYGHFIEDNYSVSDSPGGYHNGQRIVDPRLAWSEAFASFLMAVVLNNPLYRDTIGNSDGTSSYAIHYNIETNSRNAGVNKLDTPIAGSLGEGNFREFAVCRTLVDLFDDIASGLADSDTDGVTLPFSDFWDVYTDDFKNTQAFADAGHFLKLLDDAVATNFSAVLTNDEQETQASRLEYGWSNTITAPSGGQLAGICAWTLEAEDQVGSAANGRQEMIDDGGQSGVPNEGTLNAFQVSNQLKSNDFFYYYHSGGTLSVSLAYTPVSSTTADLDMYIYKTDYTFGSSARMLAYSNDLATGADDDSGTESVNVTAPAGHYMINIMYWTSEQGSRASASTNYFDAATYTLRIGTNKYFCK